MSLILGMNNLSKEIGVSRPTIYHYIELGMPCSRKGKGRYIFDRVKVFEWLESN